MSELELTEPEDLYVVCNILVDDDSDDLEYGGNRSEYFEVKYEGVSIRIPPGETKMLPLHLANHYAKHLANYILARDKRMMHDMMLRDPIINRIILRKADESDRSYTGGSEGIREFEATASPDDGGNEQSESETGDTNLPNSTEGEPAPGVDNGDTPDDAGAGSNETENSGGSGAKQTGSGNANQQPQTGTREARAGVRTEHSGKEKRL